MKNVYIYSLSCPETYIVKYIGKTNCVKTRLSKHVSGKDSSLKGLWINELKSRNLLPIMNIIDEVPSSEWEFWEKRYIAIYKSCGAELVNSTIGGKGRFYHIKKHKNNIIRKPYVMTEARIQALKKLREFNQRNGIWNKGKKYTVTLTDLDKLKRSKSQRGKHGGKPVAQYTLDGNLVKIWDSAYAVWKGLNISFKGVSLCCLNKITHANGFVWKFSYGSDLLFIGKCQGIVRGKVVLQKKLNGDLIKEWSSCAEITKTLGYDMRSISDCALGNQNSHKGFIWRYK